MSGRVTTQLVIDGRNNSQKAFKDVDSSLKQLNSRSLEVGQNLKQLFTVAAVGAAVKSYLDIAGAAGELDSRIKLATQSQEEFNEVQVRLEQLARRTYKSFSETAEVFISAAGPLRELGFTTNDTLSAVEAINLGLVASAASGDKATRVIQQFGRGLQSGVIRGDAFNAVLEDAPVLLDALAKGLGVTRAQILEMGKAGELTTARVIPALSSQIEDLKGKVEEMPTTFRDAGVVLGDAFTQAIKEFDNLSGSGGTATQVVLDFAEALRNIVKSDEFKAFAQFVGDGARGFVGIGKDLGYIAARLTGNVTELDRAEKEISKIEAALNGFGMLDLLYTDDQLRAKLKEFQDYREKLLDQMTGMNKEAREKLAEGQKAEADVMKSYQQQKLAAEQKWVSEMSSVRTKLLDDTKKAIKAQQAEEKKAVSDLEKIRSQRVDIEKKYADTYAQIAQGASGQPSYTAAQDLAFAARQSLANKDFESAKKNAEAARQMLIDLAQAGQNTYGFQGFAQQLQDIELAANDLEQSSADQKIKSIQESIKSLEDQAKVLEKVTVTPTLDDAAVADLNSKIQALAAAIGQELTIPVRLIPQARPLEVNTIPGDSDVPMVSRAHGGLIRGSGSGTSDSILARVSNGEYVLRAAAVRRLGVNALDMLNKGIPLSTFANGGLVEAAMSSPGSQPGRDLGRVDLHAGGETIVLYGDSNSMDQINRRNALKFGRTSRGK